ncbi:MAG: Asp-tRNA(Asn)/Glu-tRNA(Gln) amidotransferase subunit GatA [Pirellulaceae bacterium]
MSICAHSATELKNKIDSGELSSAQVCRAFLDQIERLDEKIGAFIQVDPDQVLRDAEAIDQKRLRGETVGPLSGLPVAIKDNLCTQGQVTSCASKMLANFRPPYDATVIAKLRAADAVLIGKTNLDEFAMGGSTENSAVKQTANPWDVNRVPGGSSGGAAACVAAKMAPLSLGTDTGGSIRQPAAFCGVTGLKPTYGRVSRYGLVAFASSLDQIGPIAANAGDAALLLSAIAGHDALDSTSSPEAVPDYVDVVSQPLTGLKIGLVSEHHGAGVDSEVLSAVDQAVKVFHSLGAEVHEVSFPHSKYGIAAYYIIAPSEASSNLARFDSAHYGYRTDEATMMAELAAEKSANPKGEAESPLIRMYRKSRAEGFGTEVKRRIMLGTYALSAGYYDAYYLKALKVRRLIRQDYDQAFQQVDLVLGPSTPGLPFCLGEMADDPLSMYLQDLCTVGANLAGVPSISIPCGFSKSGLPIGLQLQGPAFAEAKLLQAAHMFQSQTDWHQRHPELP